MEDECLILKYMYYWSTMMSIILDLASTALILGNTSVIWKLVICYGILGSVE